MSEWFYNRFLDIGKKQAAPSNMDMYLGWTKCQGMGEVFVSVYGQSFVKEPWQIRDFFRKLPGTREEIRAELEMLISIVENKKLMGSKMEFLNNMRNEFYAHVDTEEICHKSGTSAAHQVEEKTFSTRFDV